MALLIDFWWAAGLISAHIQEWRRGEKRGREREGRGGRGRRDGEGGMEGEKGKNE